MATELNALLGERIEEAKLNITVLGVGGCGCNTITRLVEAEVEKALLVAVNTDSIALNRTKAHRKVLIGETTTGGRGCGGDITKGRAAAEEDLEDVLDAIGRPDILIATCGLGGGTGSGGMPVILSAVKERMPNVNIISICTLPFKYESTERVKNAQAGLREILDYSDMTIVNLNDMLLRKVGNIPVSYAFKYMDQILVQTIQSLVSMLMAPGAVIHVDFADFVAITRNSGLGFVGHGKARRVKKATIDAIESRLLDAELTDARGCLIYVECPVTTSLAEAGEAPKLITEKYGVEKVIWGLKTRDDLREARVMVVASGVKSKTVEGLIGTTEKLVK